MWPYLVGYGIVLGLLTGMLYWVFLVEWPAEDACITYQCKPGCSVCAKDI